MKTKSLKSIEEKMAELDSGSLRYHILEAAKDFKTSWVSLGQALYSVWKDKAYKEWGYATFEAYTSKEIGIRKQTALKLLKSYFFLEKEEPSYLRQEYLQEAQPVNLPGYESINLLRLAKRKKELDSQDYARLKNDIFEKGKDASEVRKNLAVMIRERKELDPQEAWEKRRASTIRRFLSSLKALKQEIETAKLLPYPVIKEMTALIDRIESELA